MAELWMVWLVIVRSFDAFSLSVVPLLKTVKLPAGGASRLCRRQA